MLSLMKGISLVPVVKIKNAKDCPFLCEALLKGGIDMIEITFRTEAAAEAIALAAKKFPEMRVGAGTVLTSEQIIQAKEAGADFLVSPGFNPNQVKLAQKENIPFIPGTITPSEVELAMELGLNMLKFFPATAAGGIPMLKAFNAVYPVTFMPTGGISLNNINNFLDLPNVIACGGSWITPESLINEKNWTKITELVQEALKVIG